MNLRPLDTTVEAARVENEVLRRLGISGRAAMTFELSANLRRIVEDGVRYRHPEWDDEAVRHRVLRLMLGEELFREVYGNAEESG